MYLADPVLFSSVPQYLERFVRRGPDGYGKYCAERLTRTAANSARKELPCWTEEQVETQNFLFSNYFLFLKFFVEENKHTSHVLNFKILNCFT